MSDLISRNEVLELLYKIFDKYHMSTDKNTSSRDTVYYAINNGKNNTVTKTF